MCSKGDRMLRRFDPARALLLYKAGAGPALEAVFALRRSYAREALGDLQGALDESLECESAMGRSPRPAISLPARLQRARLLAALGQLDDAIRVVRGADLGPLRLRDRVPIRLLEAELQRCQGRLDRAETILLEELRAVRNHGRLTARCLIALSRVLEDRGDNDQWLKVAQGAYDTLQTVYFLPALINRGSRLVLFGVERRSQDLGAESIAAVLSVANAMLAAGRLNEFKRLTEFPISEILGFDSDDGAGRMALQAGNTVQAAEVALVLSSDATLRGHHGSAEWYATRAFQALNNARYLLRSQRHRHAWVEAHRAAIGCLLRVVAHRNPRGLIEVIENARLQGLPQRGVPDSAATALGIPDSGHPGDAHGDVPNGLDRGLRAAGISARDAGELPLRAPIGVVTTLPQRARC